MMSILYLSKLSKMSFWLETFKHKKCILSILKCCIISLILNSSVNFIFKHTLVLGDLLTIN